MPSFQRSRQTTVPSARIYFNFGRAATAALRKIISRRRLVLITGTLLVSMFLTLTMRRSSSQSRKQAEVEFRFIKTSPKITRKIAQLASSAAQKGKPEQTFDLANRESDGFFTDVPDSTWKMLKLKTASMYPNTRGDPRSAMRLGSLRSKTWFQNHYEPDFTCPLERRIGRQGDGGKWICDPHRITLKAKTDEGCLVYSVGSNGDASFESAVLQDISPDCEIHVFDFDDYAATVREQTKYSPNVYYHQWGISDVRKGPFKTLQDTVRELGHTGRTVDIFKIDCEGCELYTFGSWFQGDIILKQILVEIHYDLSAISFRIPLPYGIADSRVVLPQTVDLFERVYKEGYVIAHKEPNIQYAGLGICMEYNFLRLTPAFLNDKVELTDADA